MTEIVLARHGETESNRRGVFRGRLDVALNERGVQQAEALAEALASAPLQAVYASPLSRALETARILARPHGLEPVVDEAFNNIDLGSWQGREKALVEREDPERWRLWVRDPDRLELPGGETLASVRDRSLARARELVRAHEGGRFAVVSHRSVIKLLGGALLGLREGYFWRFYLDNAGYCVFGHADGEFVLLGWNESCHVKERVVERY